MTTREPLKDRYIGCPFQIQMCDLQGGIGLGTAFFYEAQGGTFIITNWHNLTGKDPLTGHSLDPGGRYPLYIQAKWVVRGVDPEDGTVSGHLAAHRIEIEDYGGPLWFEHPEFGSLCDVVAIPWSKPSGWQSGVFSIPANKIDDGLIPIDPGLKVLVIGFPRGLSTGPGLPVVKSGTLASTPSYEVRLGGAFSSIGGMQGGVSLPAMLLDVHTVPGMSGSPVFGEYSGFWNPRDPQRPEISGDSTFGVGRVFLGCHSSRVLEVEERAGLAICYGTDVIEAICRTKHEGSRFPRAPETSN